MPGKRPTPVLVMAIMNMVIGGLQLACQMCAGLGILFLVALLNQRGGAQDAALRDMKESLAALDAAERLATDSRNVHYLRGRVLKRLGRGADAKKEFDEAQRLADKGLARDEQILRDKITPEPELMNTPE